MSDQDHNYTEAPKPLPPVDQSPHDPAEPVPPRLAELRSMSPLSEEEEAEKVRLEAEYRSRPAEAGPVDVLTPDKASRLAELRRMQALSPLDADAAAELATLEKSPLPPGPDDKEASRLRDLRAAESKGQITDADKTELDELALKEADAAGHPRPDAIKPAVIDPVHSIIGDLVGALESMVDTVPALAAMRATIYRLKAAHARLTEPKP